MQMNMKYRLTCILPVVNDHSITALIQSLLRCYRTGNEEQMTDDLSVGNRNAVNIGNMFLWDDQGMHGRFRIDVFECDGMVVFVHESSGYLLIDYPAEQAIGIMVHF
jgi:hypothetical protein